MSRIRRREHGTVYLAAALALSGSLTIAGCSGDASTVPTATSTTFQGTFVASGGQFGTIEVTVQTTASSVRLKLRQHFLATLYAQSVAATGTLRVKGGGTTSLTGTFDAGTRALSLAGGGLTFTGALNAGVLSGTYSGSSSGGFSTVGTQSGAVTRYCGTYTTTIPAQKYIETGIWNVQVAADGVASGVTGSLTPVSQCCGLLTGRLQGNTLTLTTPDNRTVSGTIQGGSIGGSVPTGGGDPGTVAFSGSSSACQ